MSRISYFQRFSSRENHATNNALLILRRFYEESPFKIERVLSSLLDEEFEIGLSFSQQVRREGSVPDALIQQSPLRVFFETKRSGELDKKQIVRHISSIAADGHEGQTNLLVGLTKETIDQMEFDELQDLAKENSIVFGVITFSQLVEALANECADYEHDLKAIVEDFEEYLSGEGLLEERKQWLPIIACGTSYKENKRFGVYYEPPERPNKCGYRFIGIYARKCVSLIGEIKAVAVATFEAGDVNFDCEFGELEADHEARIRQVVAETEYYSLDKHPHRYYLVDKFHETKISKISSRGMRNIRYLDMRNLIQDFDEAKDLSATEIAERLKGTTFE